MASSTVAKVTAATVCALAFVVSAAAQEDSDIRPMQAALESAPASVPESANREFVLERARQAITLTDVRLDGGPDSVSLFVHTDREPVCDVFAEDDGKRLVLDFYDTGNISAAADPMPPITPIVRQVQTNLHALAPLFISRIVLDLGLPCKVEFVQEAGVATLTLTPWGRTFQESQSIPEYLDRTDLELKHQLTLATVTEMRAGEILERARITLLANEPRVGTKGAEIDLASDHPLAEFDKRLRSLGMRVASWRAGLQADQEKLIQLETDAATNRTPLLEAFMKLQALRAASAERCAQEQLAVEALENGLTALVEEAGRIQRPLRTAAVAEDLQNHGSDVQNREYADLSVQGEADTLVSLTPAGPIDDSAQTEVTAKKQSREPTEVSSSGANVDADEPWFLPSIGEWDASEERAESQREDAPYEPVLLASAAADEQLAAMVHPGHDSDSPFTSDEHLASVSAVELEKLPLPNYPDYGGDISSPDGSDEGNLANAEPLELGDLVTLNVEEAEISALLRLLSEVSRLNIVAGPEVIGSVSINLHDVPLSEALDAILGVAGFVHYQVGDITYVTTETSRAELPPSASDVTIRSFGINHMDAQELVTLAQNFLSPSGVASLGGERTLIVQDSPHRVSQIKDLLGDLDKPPRQALIEAQIITVRLDNNIDLGVGFDSQPFVRYGLEAISAGFAQYFADLAPGATGFFAGTLQSDGRAFVEALAQEADVQILAAPQILATDGQVAKIQVGERLGFRITTTTETSTLQSVEFLDVGTLLEVTPHISDDGLVRMEINPKVSNGTISPEGLPSESTTEVTTDMLVADGRTVIIGGLLNAAKQKRSSRIPVLGKIPVLGALFGRTQWVDDKSEVVLLITPHIVGPTPSAEMLKRIRGAQEEWNQFDDEGVLKHGELERLRTGEPEPTKFQKFRRSF